MKVQIKRLHPEAHLPTYVKPGDATLDIVAVSKVFDECGCVEFGTGLAINIPQGFVGLIFPRPINAKKDILLSDSVKVIHPGDDDEVKLKFKPAAYFADECMVPTNELGHRGESFDYVCFGKECIEDEDNMELYTIGDRIGQLLIIPAPVIEVVELFDYYPKFPATTT